MRRITTLEHVKILRFHFWGLYPWLDRAPKGRNETGGWWRRHDEYDRRLVVVWFALGRPAVPQFNC
jgi:hypothetical protein